MTIVVGVNQSAFSSHTMVLGEYFFKCALIFNICFYVRKHLLRAMNSSNKISSFTMAF